MKSIQLNFQVVFISCVLILLLSSLGANDETYVECLGDSEARLNEVKYSDRSSSKASAEPTSVSQVDIGKFPEVGDSVDEFIDTFGTDYSLERDSVLFPTYLWKFNEISVAVTLGINRRVRSVFIHRIDKLSSMTYDHAAIFQEAAEFTRLFSPVDDWRYLKANTDNACYYSPSSRGVVFIQLFKDVDNDAYGYSCDISVDHHSAYLNLIKDKPLPADRNSFEEQNGYPSGHVLKVNREMFLKALDD